MFISLGTLKSLTAEMIFSLMKVKRRLLLQMMVWFSYIPVQKSLRVSKQFMINSYFWNISRVLSSRKKERKLETSRMRLVLEAPT